MLLIFNGLSTIFFFEKIVALFHQKTYCLVVAIDWPVTGQGDSDDMTTISTATPEMTEETFKDRQVFKSGDIKGGWSNSQLPKLGDKVKVCFNGLGTGVITGFFEDAGFLGCVVQPDAGQRPQWHIDQFKRSGKKFDGYMVFGAEIKFID